MPLTLSDTLDDRRELWGLLHRLSPAHRMAYLHRCCQAVADSAGNGPRPLPGMAVMVKEAQRCDRGDLRLTNAIYMDLLQMAANQNLDLGRVALDLEQLARRGQPAFRDSAALRVV